MSVVRISINLHYKGPDHEIRTLPMTLSFILVRKQCYIIPLKENASLLSIKTPMCQCIKILLKLQNQTNAIENNNKNRDNLDYWVVFKFFVFSILISQRAHDFPDSS